MIGVIGTAIGAAVGSGFAVVSLILKARQDTAAELRQHQREEARRSRDRTWEITLQNLDARRETYAGVLRHAVAYDKWLASVVELPREPVPRAAGRSSRSSASKQPHILPDLEDLVFQVDVHAQDPEVGEVLREFLQKAQEAQAAIEAGDRHTAARLAAEVKMLISKLRNTCRWDLGLFATNPKEARTRPPAHEDAKRARAPVVELRGTVAAEIR
ncbi:hypothetical protein [Microbispora sp. CA-102843]|uniref:hypothetical protein n=1 Tax=Microbispora sp. CA-102843 TaxID=3239952 RepID=UPI003D928C40